VHVAAEDSHNGETRHVLSAYLTFVALGTDGRPTSVPAVLPTTEVEKRRFDEAQQRRDARLAMRAATGASH